MSASTVTRAIENLCDCDVLVDDVRRDLDETLTRLRDDHVRLERALADRSEAMRAVVMALEAGGGRVSAQLQADLVALCGAELAAAVRRVRGGIA